MSPPWLFSLLVDMMRRLRVVVLVVAAAGSFIVASVFVNHSMDSPYGIHSGYGLTKWLGTQPKNSPYGIHGLGGGIHTWTI
jgi:hypothetical protein